MPRAKVARIEMPPFHLLPQSWRSGLARQSVEPIQSGSGGALVYRVREASGSVRFLKIAVGQYIEDLNQEIKRTKWLRAQRINVPRILQATVDAEVAAVLMSSIDGQPVEESCGSPMDVVNAVAKGLAQLHALPVSSCPYSENVSIRLARARADIAQGRTDPGGFHQRNQGTSAQDLLGHLQRSAPNFPEDTVVVHGDATFSNILVNSAGRVGFVDCGHCGKADRYVDLALVSAELEDRFGERWIGPFLTAYGLSPPSWDPAKARFFLDLYELF
jgi:aminoglycoside 3'-phosphotransferase-2